MKEESAAHSSTNTSSTSSASKDHEHEILGIPKKRKIDFLDKIGTETIKVSGDEVRKEVSYRPQRGEPIDYISKPNSVENKWKRHTLAEPKPPLSSFHGKTPQEHSFLRQEADRQAYRHRMTFPGYTINRHKSYEYEDVIGIPNPYLNLQRAGYFTSEVGDLPCQKIPTEKIDNLGILKSSITEDTLDEVFKKKPELKEEYYKEGEVIKNKCAGTFPSVGKADLPTGQIICGVCSTVLDLEDATREAEDQLGRAICDFCLQKVKASFCTRSVLSNEEWLQDYIRSNRAAFLISSIFYSKHLSTNPLSSFRELSCRMSLLCTQIRWTTVSGLLRGQEKSKPTRPPSCILVLKFIQLLWIGMKFICL